MTGVCPDGIPVVLTCTVTLSRVVEPAARAPMLNVSNWPTCEELVSVPASCDVATAPLPPPPLNAIAGAVL